jgi:hypothetical protein
MDDISFFESLSYVHRGGIWADACRKKRTAVDTLQPTIPAAPNTDMPGVHPTLSQNDSVPTEGLAATEPHDQTPTPADTQSSKEASVVDGSTTHHGNPRRSWFSSPIADDASVLVDQSLEDDQLANEDARGRTSHPKVASTSTGSSSRMTEAKTGDLGQDTEDTAQPYLFSSEFGRSSSRQSQRDAYASYDSEDSTKSIYNRSAPIPRRTSDAASTMSSSSSPPGASSFLSTLRTGDGRAIKDTAKEMARKLGNWGLRKDWITTNKEPAPDNSRATKDGSSSMIHAKYADVRAAVVERKGREKMALRDATEMTTPGTAGNEVSDTPDTSANKDVMVSSSLSLPPPPEHTRRSLSRGRTVTETDDAPLESPVTPILVQPQGKTMTIPGIHANRRGEVMALGYVAPPPVTDKNKNNSFYHRLLKSPALTDEPSQDPIDVISGTSGTDEDITAMTVGPSMGGAASQTRPMPPPLPPRSLLASVYNPATNTGARISTSKNDNSLPQGKGERPELSSLENPEEEHKDLPVPEPHVPVVTSLISTAPIPPPLPPRRTQTST